MKITPKQKKIGVILLVVVIIIVVVVMWKKKSIMDFIPKSGAIAYDPTKPLSPVNRPAQLTVEQSFELKKNKMKGGV